MSFNLRFATVLDGSNAWSRRRALALELLREERADLIGFQEVLPGQRRDLELALAGYASLGEGRNGRGRGEQCCIFWRSDSLHVEQGGTFALHPRGLLGRRAWDAALPRICTFVRSAELDVLNFHLDYLGQKSRLLGLQAVLERVRPDHPTLLLGDFNTQEGSRPVRLLKEAGWLDTFRQSHPTVKRQGTFHGFSGGRNGPRIDFIFASPGLQVLQAEIVHRHQNGKFPSDHFPIKARVRL